VGEFGSGKSELALNIACEQQRALVDLDIAKPMNKSRDFLKQLNSQGITVIASPPEMDNSELRVLPSRVPMIMADSEKGAVFDVGGGESAVVIGQFASQLKAAGAVTYMVVNTLRPFSRTAAEIVSTLAAIEEKTGLKIDGLICNCNLAGETDAAVALQGLAEVEKVAAAVSLPIVGVVFPEWLNGCLPEIDYPKYFIKRFFQYIR
jgi:hypothetical protein